MTVFVLENVPEGLRGKLTRWMLEPKGGVCVGVVSAMVRDKLWMDIYKASGEGSCLMVRSAACEQGYVLETWNGGRRDIVDYEGLQLIRFRNGAPRSKRAEEG